MKKVFKIVLCLLFVFLLVGCGEQNTHREYTFSGSDDRFSLTEGKITFDKDRHEIKGGNLKVEEGLEDIYGYSLQLYIDRKEGMDSKKETLLKNSVIDASGGKVQINGDVGGRKSTGSPKIHGEELLDNLYLEIQLYKKGELLEPVILKLDVVEIKE